MRIEVEPRGWGDALPSDIEALLYDVASHINRLLAEPVVERILVAPAVGAEATPITLYRRGRSGPVTIQLTAQGRSWSQFAYQFAHEFCHVLSNYERLHINPNQWFHEALCELASVFTLRRMAERWPVQPPYPNWNGYAPSLADYADELLGDPCRQLPSDLTLRQWLTEHEEALRSDPYRRNRNSVVACQLLPFFEAEPNGWNAVRSLPISKGSLMEYLFDWKECAAPTDKPFVKRVIEAFQ